MIGRIVEVANDNRHLSMARGFMTVQENGDDPKQLGQVPLDDISAVIANAHGLSYTNSLLVALAQRGIPFVLCGANHNAVGMLLTIDGNYQQGKRFDAQLEAAKSTIKRLWGETVRAKLHQQASALAATGQPSAPLTALIRKVRSGDPDNLEAQGARRYWTLMFGEGFRRDQDAFGLNAMLNYGYTVLRATTARAVVAAGLHPTLGLHHSNDSNPMRLVDDLMEPFRPMIDLRVWLLRKSGTTDVNAEAKRALVHTLFDDMQTDIGATPVAVCVQKLATSLAQVYLGERHELDLPLPGLPIAMAASLDENQ